MKKILFLISLLSSFVVAANISATTITELSTPLHETSGLITLGQDVWTHNDSGGQTELYKINKANGNIAQTTTINNSTLVDWEDITYSDKYIYIGDFGNYNGTRTDLKIYRIKKSDINNASANAEIINFSYSDQASFTSTPSNSNYDCEAFTYYKGKLYLFSKNWGDYKTRFYELDPTPGTHIAQYRATFNTAAMVTGANINPYSNILTLITYGESDLSAGTRLFYNFTDDNFFAGETTNLNWTSPSSAQIEGVSESNLYKSYVSSEYFQKTVFGFPITFPSKLYEIDYTSIIPTYNTFAYALELPHKTGFVLDDFITTTTGMSADKNTPSCQSSVNNNVWFKFKATSNTAGITLRSGAGFGTAQNLALSLWDSTGNTELDCKASTNTDDDLYIHKTNLTVGNWYYISVDTDSATTGNFTIFLDNSPLLNDTDIFTADQVKGAMRFNTDFQKFEYYNGTTWININ